MSQTIGPRLSRRRLMAGAAAVAGATGTPADAAGRRSSSGASAYTAGYGSPRLGPIVDTTQGQVRGYLAGGVHVFRGLRYGASTAGANRFKPPVKPDPWSGVMETFIAGGGAIAPQLLPDFSRTPISGDDLTAESPPMSEDCLFLNLFTPGVNDGKKRPVMVWLHGGAWIAGAGSTDLYDGGRLASKGDTVVVTVNHRLGLFGYLYLADILGPDYADSGNNGVLDIIAALRWVKENIANFGGDPGNVTLFGWSAGGSEVCQILSMPAAEGLVHKAICQSGAILTLRTRETATQAADGVLRRLGLTRATATRVIELPMADLLKAGAGGTPTFDGRSVPRQPWEKDAPPLAAKIPLLIGGTDSELSKSAPDSVFALDEAGALSRLRRSLGETAAPDIWAAFKENHPRATPGQLIVLISSALWTTRRGTQLAERKALQGGAPVYSYMWTWRTPQSGGKYMTPHGTDLPFVWDNVARGAHRIGKGADHQAIADRVSARWLAFARTGDPNAPGLEHWAPYTLERRATLMIDRTDTLVSDPRRSEREVLAKLPDSASTAALVNLRG